MVEVSLKPKPKMSDIAWFSFYLQEHKTHNNAALVMDHLSLLWSNYQEYGILTQYLFYPHMWGENVRKRNYQCSLRTLVISLPKGVPWERRLMVTCRGPETLSLCWLWAILGPCESGISPNPPGSLSLPVPSASTPKSNSYFSKLFQVSSISAMSPFSQICLFLIVVLLFWTLPYLKCCLLATLSFLLPTLILSFILFSVHCELPSHLSFPSSCDCFSMIRFYFDMQHHGLFKVISVQNIFELSMYLYIFLSLFGKRM